MTHRLIKAARLDRLTPTLGAAKVADGIPLLPAPVAEHVEDPAVDPAGRRNRGRLRTPDVNGAFVLAHPPRRRCGYCAAPETQGVARLAHFVSQLPDLIARIAAAPWL